MNANETKVGQAVRFPRGMFGMWDGEIVRLAQGRGGRWVEGRWVRRVVAEVAYQRANGTKGIKRVAVELLARPEAR